MLDFRIRVPWKDRRVALVDGVCDCGLLSYSHQGAREGDFNKRSTGLLLTQKAGKT